LNAELSSKGTLCRQFAAVVSPYLFESPIVHK
jgi:hypothetical protein